jgi:magnesium-transporting ATPase (P-type)
LIALLVPATFAACSAALLFLLARALGSSPRAAVGVALAVLVATQASAYEDAVGAADVKINAFFFNVFIFLQLGNLLNARKINDEWNIFQGVFSSYIFMGIFALILGFQIMIMEVDALNFIFGIQKIPVEQWGISVACCVLCVVYGYGLRALSRIVNRNEDNRPEIQNIAAFNAPEDEEVMLRGAAY